MIPFLFIATAIAAPEGYKLVKETEDCTLFSGPVDKNGVAPMFAECHWPEVAPENLQAMLGVFEAYNDYIFAIESCTIVRTEGERTLVHQVQNAPAIANREVVVWMEKIPVEGGFRFTWKNDPNEPISMASGSVRAPRNEGYWEVTAHPETGSVVFHAVTYDPGGRVPSWLVRKFSIGGLSDVMKQVRGLAVKSVTGDDESP